jgi:hypothetical protein
LIQSAIAIIGLIMLVLGVVASIYALRYALTDSLHKDAQTVASVLNAIQISILNYVYTLVAEALTNRENHRTDTEYEDSMVVKLFVFQFVNSYCSFFYLAFLATSTNAEDDALAECSGSACMVPLAINLAVIFGTRLLSNNFSGLVVPYLQYLWRMRDGIGDAVLTRPQREFMMEYFDTMKNTLYDYANLAIMFGYISLFVTALPFAACAGLISIYVESKGAAWKFTRLYQRPIPRGCEDIGSWQAIFTVISVAAVLTNAGLTCFTMDTLDDVSTSTRYVIFILFQLSCFALQYFLMEVIPDVPESISIQKQRTEFLRQKFIQEIPDDEYILSDMNHVQSAEIEVNFDMYPG